MSSKERMGMWANTSASGRLGVSTVAMGNNCWQKASTASGCIRGDPLVDTMTGSTTTKRGW